MTDKCESCGREIADTEVSHLWGDEVVTCGSCNDDPRQAADVALDLCEDVDSEWHIAHNMLKDICAAIGTNTMRDVTAPERLVILLNRWQDKARIALKLKAAQKQGEGSR